MFIDSHNQISKEKLRGKVIAYPTDTVFGIGAMIDDLEAINKIYKLYLSFLNNIRRLFKYNNKGI